MQKPNLTWEVLRGWLFGLALPLLLGMLAAATIPQPVVGVIYLNDAIYSYTAQELITQIDYAIEHPEVRAVVLALNSPGGTVVDTEAVYMELARLRAKKPVVAVVNGMAASGAYYLAVGADYIYAKPTSQVGNVGVIGYMPPVPFILEEVIWTGPYKAWGSPRDAYQREVEIIKMQFYQAVSLGRGERLNVGPEVVLRGQIWTGSEALRLGLIDALGTENDATCKAAEMARIWHYETADLRDLAGIQTPYYPYFFQHTQDGATLPYPSEPGLYLLFIPPLPAGQ